jgi:lysophospholipid acyltransferase
MRQFTYDDLDITGPQMVLTLKLTSFAWNVWDGRRPVEVFVDQSEKSVYLTW